MTSAERFYAKHYEDGLAVGLTPLPEYEAAMFHPGGRYRLASEYFNAHDPTGKTLVEIGCGGAEALLILAQRHAFGQLIGIDVALPEQSAAKEITALKSDLDAKWPLADGSVDYLLAMMVLEHLYDPFHAFAEVGRVLKPDGVAFVNLPLVTSLQNRWRLLIGKVPVTSVPYDSWFSVQEWDGAHLHYFSVASIRRLARATGLEMSRIRGVGRLSGLKSAFPGFLASEITFVLTPGRA